MQLFFLFERALLLLKKSERWVLFPIVHKSQYMKLTSNPGTVLKITFFFFDSFSFLKNYKCYLKCYSYSLTVLALQQL